MGRKHCGKRSNFYFSHSVFKRPVLQTRTNQVLFGKELRLDIVVKQEINSRNCSYGVISDCAMINAFHLYPCNKEFNMLVVMYKK